MTEHEARAIVAAERRLPDLLRRLQDITEENEPGLMTWNMMRARIAEDLYKTLGILLYGTEGKR